jgi:thiosulfate dehydrogenase (quinone) large subunit
MAQRPRSSSNAGRNRPVPPRAPIGTPAQSGGPRPRLDRVPVRGGLRGSLIPPDASVAAAALLPLRFFFGVTFLYAGLDKLLDPSFFDAASGSGIHAQLAGFVRSSPLGPLVQAFALPYPELMGGLIALGEVAVGIGALTGILFRLAALGGLLLSLLFFLTASWTVRPYYYGPDLPYAFGWLTLAAAGTGRILELEPWLAARIPFLRGGEPEGADWSSDAGRRAGADPTRRYILQVAILGAASLVVAAAATAGRMLLGRTEPHRTAGGPGAPTAGGGTTPAPASPGGASTPIGASAAPTSAAGASAAPPANLIARVTDLASTPAVGFTVPSTGDPGILVKLSDGTFVAYDAVCTHEGCTVGFDPSSGDIVCPCHGAVFDPARSAAVLAGPARAPLAKVPVNVDKSTGAITLAG